MLARSRTSSSQGSVSLISSLNPFLADCTRSPDRAVEAVHNVEKYQDTKLKCISTSTSAYGTNAASTLQQFHPPRRYFKCLYSVRSSTTGHDSLQQRVSQPLHYLQIAVADCRVCLPLDQKQKPTETSFAHSACTEI